MTSIGVAYPLDLTVPDLARHVVSLLGTILLPLGDAGWPLQLVGVDDSDVWVETTLKRDAGAANRRLLERFFTERRAELSGAVALCELGTQEVALRPETRYAGILMDLADADLYPEEHPAPGDLVASALRELLLRWYEVSRFQVAFVDHEAEFEVVPETLGPCQEQYALLALPGDVAGGSPLRFHQTRRLSPLGS